MKLQKSRNGNYCDGQSVKFLFSNVPSFNMNIEYVHLTKNQVFIEVTRLPRRKGVFWNGPPDVTWCFICDKKYPISKKWLYCLECQSGPFCSEPCRLKCVTHRGFVSRQERGALGPPGGPWGIH